MKPTAFISILVLALTVSGCRNKRSPGRVYMPDMFYSRAYETYASKEDLRKHGIHYDGKPVAGTIKRGEAFPFSIAKDRAGDSTNYYRARQILDPLPKLDTLQLKEAERLYLVNCGICHGQKLNGNGPLYNDGKGPFAAKPKDLIADPIVKTMPEGQIFYSVTYGKGQMGSYASQLSTTQRWMVIQYIKGQQAGTTASSGAAAGGTDSTTKK